MKKSILKLMCIAALTTAFVSAGVSAQENLCDPFNNDLFIVEKEITYEGGNLPVSMEDYTIEANEDYSLAKIVKVYYNENGEKISVDMTDFLGEEEFNKKYEELVMGSEYNDGLKLVRGEDGMSFSYVDINNNEVAFGFRGQGASFSYNLGILRDAYGGMNMDTGEYDNFTTTLSKVMTDNTAYTFEAAFTDFNDMGYAMMEKDNKYYIIKLKKGDIITVMYNGEKINFDQIPVIENGRTLVPLRAIFEKIGATVDWNGDTQTVTATKDDTSVSLTINNTVAIKNGEEITLDVPAKIIGGRTLVPVRFVSDCFGVAVEWDGTMQRVTLTK